MELPQSHNPGVSTETQIPSSITATPARDGSRRFVSQEALAREGSRTHRKSAPMRAACAAISQWSFVIESRGSCYIPLMPEYTEQHAKSGIDAPLPGIECWPNQFPGYEITIAMPEFTSICPKTGLPDFGTITIRYRPDKLCLELKSLKGYCLAFRNLGIFYENAVNRILRDVAGRRLFRSPSPTGEFNTRGGMKSVIEAEYPAPSIPSSSR